LEVPYAEMLGSNGAELNRFGGGAATAVRRCRRVHGRIAGVKCRNGWLKAKRGRAGRRIVRAFERLLDSGGWA
jgi:hypothetical protein